MRGLREIEIDTPIVCSNNYRYDPMQMRRLFPVLLLAFALSTNATAYLSDTLTVTFSDVG